MPANRAGSLEATARALVAEGKGILAADESMVPIVEPEVLMDGEHSIERHGDVTEATLHRA